MSWARSAKGEQGERAAMGAVRTRTQTGAPGTQLQCRTTANPAGWYQEGFGVGISELAQTPELKSRRPNPWHLHMDLGRNPELKSSAELCH